MPHYQPACEAQSSDLLTLEPRIDQTSAQSFEVLGIPSNQREPMSRGRSSKERIHLRSGERPKLSTDSHLRRRPFGLLCKLNSYTQVAAGVLQRRLRPNQILTIIDASGCIADTPAWLLSIVAFQSSARPGRARGQACGAFTRLTAVEGQCKRRRDAMRAAEEGGNVEHWRFVRERSRCT
jgi:hypothetical protein